MAIGLDNVGINAVKLLCWIPSAVAKVTRYLAGLSKPSADVLLDEAGRLEAKMNDLRNSVETEEKKWLRKRTGHVEKLLKDAADLLNQVQKFKSSCIYRTPCFKDFPCWVTDMLQQVRELKGDLNSELVQESKKLIGNEPLPGIEEVPDPGELVGREQMLSDISERLNKDDRIIRIYGLAGTGKTALLRSIYHKLRDQGLQGAGGKGNEPRAPVIFAEVSKELDVLRLQTDIARQLGLVLTNDASSNERERAGTLRQGLNKKFVLLLDGVGEDPSWDRIGIPEAGSGNIILTTDLPQDGAVKINYLSHEDSWKLFCGKLENRPDDPVVLECMRTAVINRGGGLPRAIEAMAKDAQAMHIIDNYRWQDIAQRLQCSPHKLKNMKEEVFPPLKCNFDNWEEKYKKCLLYCSLFPEDQNIYRDQLIDYWIGEGFVDEILKAPYARDEGRKIVNKLVADCFLERMLADDPEEVKLHDVVRSMVMWLTDGTQSEHWKLHLMSTRLEEFAVLPWEKVERIASMKVNGRREFPPSDKGCHHLLTLLYNNCKLNGQQREQNPPHGEGRSMGPEQRVISGEPENLSKFTDRLTGLMGKLFFYSSNYMTVGRSMEAGQCIVKGEPKNLFKLAKNLKVLDLSGTNIEALPAEIRCLVELQYLNVSYTNISSLPSALSELNRLKHLKLRGTHNLGKLPSDPIPSLLQILDIFDSGYAWSPTTGNFPHGQEGFGYLEEIGLTIDKSASLEKSFISPELRKRIVFLTIKDVKDLRSEHLSSVFKNMDNLRELLVTQEKRTDDKVKNLKIDPKQLQKLHTLDLHHLTSLESIDVSIETAKFLVNFRRLHISHCHGLTHITWVHGLKNIVEIKLRDCQGIEVLFEAGHLLEKLKEIHLIRLPKLDRIAGHPVRLPSLSILSVIKCSRLQKLSFNADTVTNIKEIKGEREWWDRLQWDANDTTKSVLEMRFKEVP